MAKYCIFDTLAEAEAAQLSFDKKLGYRDDDGDVLYSTSHAFDIIEHPDGGQWAIHINPVSGLATASVEFRGIQLPIESLSGKAIIRDITGDNVIVKTESQMRNDGWFIKYEQGEPIEGTY